MTRKRWSGALIALALVVASACGDDEDGPESKCNGLVAGGCGLADECGLLTNAAQCRRDQSRVMRCEEVEGIGQGYERCVADIKARTCEAWGTALNQNFALPESCRTAMAYPK